MTRESRFAEEVRISRISHIPEAEQHRLHLRRAIHMLHLAWECCLARMLEGAEAGSAGTFKCKINMPSAIKTYLQDINSTSSSRPTCVLKLEAAIMRSIAPLFLVVLQSLIIGSNASEIFDRDSG